MAKKKKQLRLLLKLLAKLQSKLAKLQSKLAKLLKKLLPLLLTLLPLLKKLLPLLAKLPPPLAKLLLPLLPSNSGSRNEKNRPTGRFFFACVSRKPTKSSKILRPRVVFGETAISNLAGALKCCAVNLTWR